MKILRATLIFALSFVFATAAYPADWRYVGFGGGQANAQMFYDASDIQRPTPETVRVWVKGITLKALSQYKPSKQLIKEAAHKMAAGYVPRFLLLPGISEQFRSHGITERDARASTTLWEIFADNDDVQPVVSAYWQLDCRGERAGLLSLTTFKPNGNIDKTQDFSVPTYGYIAPDTTARWLSELVCPKR